MEPSNKPRAPGASLPGVDPVVAMAVEQIWHGAIGRTVRCVPTRRTVMADLPDGRQLFGKFRQGRAGDAAREWRWLHLLPLLGLHVAAPVAWLRCGRRSLLVTAAVPGRGYDAWIAAARAEGWWPELVQHACTAVAPLVRRLHGQGLVFRDLYWNHLFHTAPRGAAAPTFLDVERVLRPWWRRRRWVVKDLAGLLASVPGGCPPRVALRFARAYLQAPLREHRGWLRAVARKAARIAAHAPKFG